MPVDEIVPGCPGEPDDLLSTIHGIEERVAAFAAAQELQLEDLRQLVDQVRLEQRQAEAEIALYGEQATGCANEALARADDALQRLTALAAGSASREGAEGAPASGLSPVDAGATAAAFETIEQRLALIAREQDARLGELRERVERSVRAVEQRLAGLVTEQEARLAELRQRLDDVQRQQQNEAEAATRVHQVASQAHAALALAEEAVQRIDRLPAAPPVRETTADDLLQRSAAWEVLVQSVRDVDRRVTALAARQDSDMAALRQSADQVRGEQGSVVAQIHGIHAVSREAVGHADDARQRADAAWERIAALTDTARCREADTLELLERLSRGWETLSQSVCDVEQRVSQVAARYESRLDDLRQYVDRNHHEQCQLIDRASVHGEQVGLRATEAMARADAALERIGTVAATSQVREAATTEMLSRLSAGWETLDSTMRDVERRLAVRQETALEELRQLVDQAQGEQRHAAGEAALWGEQATVRANEAVSRADETIRRLEAVAAASQAHDDSITEFLGRLSAGWDGVSDSVRAVERRVAAVEAEVGPLKAAAAARAQRPRAVDSPAFAEARVPEPTGADPGAWERRSPAFASWLALTAPGALLTLALLGLILVAGPWVSGELRVDALVRACAGALLLLHAGTASAVLKPGGQRWAAAAVLALLAADALGAGVLWGADLRMDSPAMVFCVAVAAMSAMVGGAAVGVASLLTAGVGVGTAQAVGLLPLVVAPAVWFPTTLSVETSFANVPAFASVAPAFTTMLSVETTYAGRLVSSVGSSAALFMPVVAIVLVAICLGVGVNLAWGRKVRGTNDAEFGRAQGSMVRT